MPLLLETMVEMVVVAVVAVAVVVSKPLLNRKKYSNRLYYYSYVALIFQHVFFFPNDRTFH